MIQKRVEERMLGRVFGLVSSVGNASIPLAIRISGVLLTHLRLDVILGVCGLVLIPVSLGSWQIYRTNKKISA